MCILNFTIKKRKQRIPVVVPWKQIKLASMKMQVLFLPSLSGLRTRRCHELLLWPVFPDISWTLRRDRRVRGEREGATVSRFTFGHLVYPPALRGSALG